MNYKRGNLYGILLLVLLVVVMMGLFEPKIPTGFAVKENKCFDGTAFGECSSLQSRYCDNGALKKDCQRCGCNTDEVCQNDGSCLPKCADGTVFGSCSQNKPLLCFKGSLLENCFKCGCFPGQTCSNDGTCTGDIELGAGAEEKIKEAPEEKQEVKEEPKPEIKEAPEASFFRKLFCRIFYFDEYDACIS